MEFLKNNEAAIYKRLLYSANEQQVEVIERYEEKCKRSIVHSKRKRWCPKLSEYFSIIKFSLIFKFKKIYFFITKDGLIGMPQLLKMINSTNLRSQQARGLILQHL